MKNPAVGNNYEIEIYRLPTIQEERPEKSVHSTLKLKFLLQDVTITNTAFTPEHYVIGTTYLL